MSDRWCFTVFDNVPQPIVPDDEDVSYLVFQREECPETERLHWQGYIEFKSRKRFSTVQRFFQDQGLKKFHIEPAKGQPSQCRAYCTKEETAVDDPFEYGTIQPDREQGKRNDIAEIVAYAKTHTLLDTIEKFPASIRIIKHLATYQGLANKPQHRQLTVYYIHGAPGTGKSKEVYSRVKNRDFYRPLIAPPNIWFDGYQGEKYLWLDDLDVRSHNREFILHLLDPYPLILPVKGGSVAAQFTTVYITSNVHPKDLSKAVRRRFTKVFDYDASDSEADS